MEPPNKKRKTRRRRRLRNWGTEVAFLFFTMLFLTLALENKSSVYADSEEMHDRMDNFPINGSTITIMHTNISE